MKGDLVTTSFNLPSSMLLALRRAAARRALEGTGKPSISSVVRELLDRHREEFEEVRS